MQELMMELVRRAHMERTVALAGLADGMQLLAYPMDDGVLIGLGLENERAQRIDPARVLQKRAGDMPRLGHWLPVVLKDGGWYVVKRLPSFHLAMATLDEHDLAAAAELLA